MDRPVGEHEKRFQPLIELLEIEVQHLGAMQCLLHVWCEGVSVQLMDGWRRLIQPQSAEDIGDAQLSSHRLQWKGFDQAVHRLLAPASSQADAGAGRIRRISDSQPLSDRRFMS